MEDQRSRRQIPLGIMAGLSALVLATGSAVGWWSWQASHKTPSAVEHSQGSSEQQKVPPIASAPTATQKPPTSAAPASQSKTLQVYWLKASGSAIALSPSPATISTKDQQTPTVSAAIEALLAGPSNTAVTTTIPSDTKLRSLTVKDDGIYIDLSQVFTQGGGSTSMTARLGQVLYTATSLNPTAKVWLSVEGKPLETLGGEGLMVDQPLTREGFKRDFPL
ncbi:GerMN domain-containing protein [Stenomitos frigidus]|uniref:Spore germination protein n=1 Tax=Stenomitos frigidus ULC18 TaxID=2107698 RepID=A0A2T1ESC2_9CYAN|nr:GerMN domain-containing protein [Stenomitos frigidus]PSB35593.1 spore germination protein [Stenomitos frigidus ULC18]